MDLEVAGLMNTIILWNNDSEQQHNRLPNRTFSYIYLNPSKLFEMRQLDL